MRSSYMKKTGRCIGLLAGLALLSGCGQQGEAQSVPPVEDAGTVRRRQRRGVWSRRVPERFCLRRKRKLPTGHF